MTIKILFGSETGNSEGLANGAKKDLENSGYKSSVIDMGDITINDLQSYEKALIITSTWGNGEPPTNAEKLYNELDSATNINLSNLSYGVFAIGQSMFENFCQTGIDFDNFLEKFGAKRMLPITTSDDDFDDKFPIWLKEIKTKI